MTETRVVTFGCVCHRIGRQTCCATRWSSKAPRELAVFGEEGAAYRSSGFCPPQSGYWLHSSLSQSCRGSYPIGESSLRGIDSKVSDSRLRNPRKKRRYGALILAVTAHDIMLSVRSHMKIRYRKHLAHCVKKSIPLVRGVGDVASFSAW